MCKNYAIQRVRGLDAIQRVPGILFPYTRVYRLVMANEPMMEERGGDMGWNFPRTQFFRFTQWNGVEDPTWDGSEMVRKAWYYNYEKTIYEFNKSPAWAAESERLKHAGWVRFVLQIVDFVDDDVRPGVPAAPPQPHPENVAGKHPLPIQHAAIPPHIEEATRLFDANGVWKKSVANNVTFNTVRASVGVQLEYSAYNQQRWGIEPKNYNQLLFKVQSEFKGRLRLMNVYDIMRIVDGSHWNNASVFAPTEGEWTIILKAISSNIAVTLEGILSQLGQLYANVSPISRYYGGVWRRTHAWLYHILTHTGDIRREGAPGMAVEWKRMLRNYDKRERVLKLKHHDGVYLFPVVVNPSGMPTRLDEHRKNMEAAILLEGAAAAEKMLQLSDEIDIERQSGTIELLNEIKRLGLSSPPSPSPGDGPFYTAEEVEELLGQEEALTGSLGIDDDDVMELMGGVMMGGEEIIPEDFDGGMDDFLRASGPLSFDFAGIGDPLSFDYTGIGDPLSIDFPGIGKFLDMPDPLILDVDVDPDGEVYGGGVRIGHAGSSLGRVQHHDRARVVTRHLAPMHTLKYLPLNILFSPDKVRRGGSSVKYILPTLHPPGIDTGVSKEYGAGVQDTEVTLNTRINRAVYLWLWENGQIAAHNDRLHLAITNATLEFLRSIMNDRGGAKLQLVAKAISAKLRLVAKEIQKYDPSSNDISAFEGIKDMMEVKHFSDRLKIILQAAINFGWAPHAVEMSDQARKFLVMLTRYLGLPAPGKDSFRYAPEKKRIRSWSYGGTTYLPNTGDNVKQKAKSLRQVGDQRDTDDLARLMLQRGIVQASDIGITDTLIDGLLNGHPPTEETWNGSILAPMKIPIDPTERMAIGKYLERLWADFQGVTVLSVDFAADAYMSKAETKEIFDIVRRHWVRRLKVIRSRVNEISSHALIILDSTHPRQHRSMLRTDPRFNILLKAWAAEKEDSGSEMEDFESSGLPVLDAGQPTYFIVPPLLTETTHPRRMTPDIADGWALSSSHLVAPWEKFHFAARVMRGARTIYRRVLMSDGRLLEKTLTGKTTRTWAPTEDEPSPKRRRLMS